MRPKLPNKKHACTARRMRPWHPPHRGQATVQQQQWGATVSMRPYHTRSTCTGRHPACATHTLFALRARPRFLAGLRSIDRLSGFRPKAGDPLLRRSSQRECACRDELHLAFMPTAQMTPPSSPARALAHALAHALRIRPAAAALEMHLYCSIPSPALLLSTQRLWGRINSAVQAKLSGQRATSRTLRHHDRNARRKATRVTQTLQTHSVSVTLLLSIQLSIAPLRLRAGGPAQPAK